MRPASDFNTQLDLAAAKVNDATNLLRGALVGRVPAPHRRRVTAATHHLERAERELFMARNDPWAEPEKPRQLSLAV